MSRRNSCSAVLISDSDAAFKRHQQDESGFFALSQMLKEAAGIHLPSNEKNKCLMASRLGLILRERKLDSYSEYLKFLKKTGTSAVQEFVSALTTNTTQFFRESKHFDILKAELPSLLKRKATIHRRELRVWCSAASTGQEPFTIAMVLLEAIPELSTWSIKFLATDIDLEVLQRACNGIYSSAEVESIPALYRQKYFEQVVGKGGSYRVRPEILKLIQFARFNLLTEQYPFRYPFDIVFCRNVLIYFDAKTSQHVVHKLGATLSAGGLLFLGHSESGAMKSANLIQIAPAAYKRVDPKGLIK